MMSRSGFYGSNLKSGLFSFALAWQLYFHSSLSVIYTMASLCSVVHINAAPSRLIKCHSGQIFNFGITINEGYQGGSIAPDNHARTERCTVSVCLWVTAIAVLTYLVMFIFFIFVAFVVFFIFAIFLIYSIRILFF